MVSFVPRTVRRTDPLAGVQVAEARARSADREGGGGPVPALHPATTRRAVQGARFDKAAGASSATKALVATPAAMGSVRWFALAMLLAPAVRGQTAAAGFAVSVRYTATGVQHDIAALGASRDGSTLWVAHRSWLYAVDAQGTATLVHALPQGEWIGALTVDAGGGRVWFTNWTTSALLVHDPSNGRTQTAGSVPANTFDLAFLPATTTLLATANPSWPAPGARPGVWRIDSAGGHHEVVQLTGASGPLAFTANGDLLCVTVSATFPPPPASASLLRFSAARLAQALAGGPALVPADARLVARFDNAYDLAVDDRERGYVTDASGGRVWSVDLATGTRDATPILDTGAAGSAQLAWIEGTGPATFAPWQPPGGGRLCVAVADWTNVRTQVVEIAAARASLEVLPALPVPRGPARLVATGAVPAAPCVLFVSELPLVATYTAFPWQGAPMRLDLDPRVPPLAWPVLADASGHAEWPFHHGGGAATLWAQALSLSPAAGGTTPAVRVELAR